MVYINFPNNLTEEEEMLQRKYTKLRKKKRTLQLLRAQQKQEPQPRTETPIKQSSEEAANATARAKNLLKAGAIKLLSDKKEQSGFKRSKRMKDTSGDKPAVGFTPFSVTQSESTENYNPSEQDSSEDRPQRKGLHESFVSSYSDDRSHREATDPRDEDGERSYKRRPMARTNRRDRSELEPPVKGNTVYVHGNGITEDLLQRAFSKIGTVLNVSMEEDKSCGFVTFERMECADEAIAQMNGTMESDIQLRVSMARRQPPVEPPTDAATSSWSNMTANSNQKSTLKDDRDLVTYEDMDIFGS